MTEASAFRQIIREEKEKGYIEFAPSFLQIEDKPVQYLIDRLIPVAVQVLCHGEPRTRKSWAALEIGISVSTGTPAFNLFQTPQTFPILYLSQEDDAARVRNRAKRILAGKKIEKYPDTLAFAVHKGINLESSKWQEKLLKDVKHYGFKLLIWDPIRRFSPSCDKGPAEVRMVTAFLRQVSVETGAANLVNHHDIKPSSNGQPDTRRRGHRASGEDWFATTECPISFEQAGPQRTLVLPEDYKFSGDPSSFVFHIDEDEAKTYAKLIAEQVKATEATSLALDERVLEYLSEHTSSSGNSISKGCRSRRVAITESLERLLRARKVDFVKRGRKKEWFLARS